MKKLQTFRAMYDHSNTIMNTILNLYIYCASSGQQSEIRYGPRVENMQILLFPINLSAGKFDQPLLQDQWFNRWGTDLSQLQ